MNLYKKILCTGWKIETPWHTDNGILVAQRSGCESFVLIHMRTGMQVYRGTRERPHEFTVHKCKYTLSMLPIIGVLKVKTIAASNTNLNLSSLLVGSNNSTMLHLQQSILSYRLWKS